MLISCGSNTAIPLPSTPEQKLSVILSLDPGNTLKYSANGSGNVNEGVLQEVTSDSLYIWCNEAEISVGTSDIDSLWVSRRLTVYGLKTGAIIGFSIVGGSAFSIFSLFNEDIRHALPFAAYLAIIGGVGGGGIGACFGAATIRWERLL